MKFSEQWLRELVNPTLSSQDLAEQLSLAGLEVDSITPVASGFSNVVVGEVLDVKQHPDADRLRVCQVNVGEPEVLTIVCGAENVRAGLKVAVAKIGAVLQDDFKIKKSKLRGVESCGMICSESELGLAESSKGIMELPQDAPIGEDLRKFLNLDDMVFDIELTPNRGDCLSILGIAREVGVLNHLRINYPYKKDELEKQIRSAISVNKNEFPISVINPQECPRYVGMTIRNIKTNVDTPLWVKERLRRSDIRSIHPIVDITNYVMLELGQPLHAFDLDSLSGGITVRLAVAGESIQLLDEQSIDLDENSLVITDDKHILALAGIKGGADSGITEKTQNIFLESAFFVPNRISATAKKYKLFTDSSHRFERGVDPEIQVTAIYRAASLIMEILGGEIGKPIEIFNDLFIPRRNQIQLRHSQISRILGIDINDTDIEKILSSLGMKLHATKEGWSVTPPSYRSDIKIEVDLIEELARIYGYKHIPSRRVQEELVIAPISEQELNLRRVRDLFIDKGYHEAITYSFVDETMDKLLAPHEEPLKLLNPISSDMSVMRTQLWSGLIKALHYNENRQQDRVRLFEIGLCFRQRKQNLSQQLHLGGVVTGSDYPEQWGQELRLVDFFDVKGDIESLFNLIREQEFTFEPSKHPALHPGKAADILIAGNVIGHLGALHPRLYQELDLKNEVFLFDLNLEPLKKIQLPAYQMISKFPAIRRDLAVVVPQEVSSKQIVQKILDSSGELLKNVHVFDVYQGKEIGTGKKSIALRLSFQDLTRTLIDNEINELMQKIIHKLQTEFNATLRD